MQRTFAVPIFAAFALIAGCTFDPSGLAGADGATYGQPDAAGTADAPSSDEPTDAAETTDAASWPDAAGTIDAATSPDAEVSAADASLDSPDATPGADAGPLEELVCDDGGDDDADGDVDCQDSDCPGCGALQMCCPDGSCALVAVGCLIN